MIESKFMYKLSRWLLASALTVGMSWPAAALQISAAPGSGGGSGGITIGQAVTGGTPSTLIYNDSGGLLANSKTIPFGIVITPAVNTNALKVTGYSLTGTDTHALLDLAGTLNTSGSLDVLALRTTYTSAGASTSLLSLYSGASGTNKVFGVTGNGVNLSQIALSTTGSASFTLLTDTSSFARIGPLGLVYTGGGLGILVLPNTGALEFSASSSVTAQGDTILLRDGAANTLAQRNGVNAQTFNIYNTYTDASNYERGFVRWSGSQFQIGSEVAGTGIARFSVLTSSSDVGVQAASGKNIRFFIGGAEPWDIVSTGHLVAGTDNTYDIGASGANRPRSEYLGTKLVTPVTVVGGSVPTLALAGGTCAGTVIAGGATAGTVTLTGACVTTNTMTLSVMPTAPTGYTCDAIDRTLGTSLLGETSTTTTSVVFTFTGTTGVDVIQYKCMAY